MKQWSRHLFIISILLILFLGAVFYRGKQAIIGITGGLTDLECIVNQDSCTVQVSELSIKFGIYDKVGNYSKSDLIAVDHYFISWSNFDSKELSQSLHQSTGRNRWPLVTVEPWNNNILSKDSILTDISQNKYDQEIRSVCSTFKQYNQPLFIRFGHEMEKVTGRYPWAVNDSTSYRNAHRYFVEKCKEIYPLGYYVWSPVGDKGLEQYYPGDDVVDYVGISVYGLASFDRNVYGHVRTFEEIVNEKYERIKKYNKPIMIAEFGISGTDSYQKKWLKQGFDKITKFPLIKMVVYFNSVDNVGAWGEEYGIPDWSISDKVFIK